MGLYKFENIDSSILYDNSKPLQKLDYTYLSGKLSNPVKEPLIPKNKSTEISGDSVPEGSKFKIGSDLITVTDPFGIRHFKGREGQHSTGIDYTTNSGNAVALTDGIIESVKLDGDGKVFDPRKVKGSAAGWYVTVKNTDGTKAQYMHLDPMNEQEMKSLEGKKLKKGDVIWSYKIGSGSSTGSHVKLRVYTGSSPLNSYIDPSYLFK